MSWDADTATTTRPSRIDAATWSPCNRFIAIAWSGSTTVDVLDSATLQRLQTLESPPGISTVFNTSVFSPDSRTLTCCCRGYMAVSGRDKHIISWDLQTGGVAGVIPVASVRSSITYSANGEMVGVIYRSNNGSTSVTSVSIFDVATGECRYSHSVNGDILSSNIIWTHGESLQFATANANTITIWNVGFALGAAPMAVESLPTPGRSDRDREEPGLLLVPGRLAFAFQDGVLVWSTRNHKCLLNWRNEWFDGRSLSFSSDGRFLACSESGTMVYIWKESPAGYSLHETLAVNARYPNPLLSQNGELMVVLGDRTIRLWRTNYFTPSPFRDPQRALNFILDFSPDGVFAAYEVEDERVVVVNLNSGVQQLTIDTDMQVYGLRVIGNAVFVAGRCEAIAWDLPAEDSVPSLVGREGSSRVASFDDSLHEGPISVSISPDFRHVAVIWEDFDDVKLDVRRMTTAGEPTDRAINVNGEPDGHTAWFTPDGRDVWCVQDSGRAETWRLSERSSRWWFPQEHTVDIEHPPEGYPWGSSCGYQVTNDWWILDPDGKRLLMLPPPWRSIDAVRRVWKGQFLALLHIGLSEPVILELIP